jgi:hypothetical protein
MQIVLSYIVENEKVDRDKLASQFETDWNKAKTAVIKKEPETWSACQVIKHMENKMGWQILHVSDPITVTH